MAYTSSRKKDGIDSPVIAASKASNAGALDRAAETGSSTLTAGTSLNVGVRVASQLKA
jgi:hypothetical protein